MRQCRTTAPSSPATWVRVDHGTLTLVDPATEEPFADLALAGPDDVDAAVAAARDGPPGLAGGRPGGRPASRAGS